MTLVVGQPAPDFTLPNADGEPVQLSSLRGTSNIVLAFFPLAFTDTCTAEMCAFSDDIEQFAGSDARIFGISVDSSPTLKEFVAKHDIKVDLLSDFKREVCRAYGTLLEDHGFASRTYVIVDKSGTVRWVHTEELGNRLENRAMLAQLEALG